MNKQNKTEQIHNTENKQVFARGEVVRGMSEMQERD